MASVGNSSETNRPKVLREQFVQDLNGTTMGEVMLFSAQLPLFVFLTVFIELCVLKKFNIFLNKSSPNSIYSAIVFFVVETVTLVIPLVSMFTILSDFVQIVLLINLAIILAIIIHSVSCPDEKVQYWRLPDKQFFSENVVVGRQAFVTYFRSFVFLVTAISILAVDFHIFPRRFAKTETYGVSLMDLGVGLFVISSAIVKKKSVQEVSKTLLECSVFIVLGVLRYLVTHYLDYQEHITEYGTHWNFFFTLASVKLLSHLLTIIFQNYSLICGLVLLTIHQYFLSTKLEAYVVSSQERDNLFSANKEGIVSLCGYLSLYFFGVVISNIVNPQDKQKTTRNKIITLCWLFILCISLFLLSYYLDSTGFKISRRLANMSYVSWVITVSLALLAVSLMIELLLVWFLPIQPQSKDKLYCLVTPAILESINYNALLFFLISNIITGLVNLNVDVLDVGKSTSIAILCGYSILNCAFVYQLYISNIHFKFW